MFQSKQGLYGGYKRLECLKDDSVVIVSASLSNTYLIFGYKETTQTQMNHIDTVQVYAVEGTVISPEFSSYESGRRDYCIKNWDEFGNEDQISMFN